MRRPSETEAPVQADPDEIYAALMDAIDSTMRDTSTSVAAMGACHQIRCRHSC